jgi:tetratricopeptide (TPR) repeat protein
MKGLVNYKKRDYPNAEGNFKRSVFWKHKYIEAIINLAKTQLAQNKITETKETIERLCEIAPNNAETYALHGQLLIKAKDFISAIEQLNKAIASDSLLSYAFYYRGIARANMNDLTGAASDYTKAQQLDISNVEALIKGAIVFSRLENYEAAIENYNKILKLDPSNAAIFLQRGNFKMKIGDYKNAIRDFNMAISLVPDPAEAYYNRGRSFAQIEEYDSAIGDFEKAAELNYKMASANYNIGLAFLKLNQPGKAKKYLENSIKNTDNTENSGNAYHLLGIMEMMLNKYKNAINYFNLATEHDTTLIEVYYNRAIAYGFDKNYKNALSDLNRCISMGKQSAEVYFARGVQKINLNDFAGGCEDLTTAANMNYSQAQVMKKTYCK